MEDLDESVKFVHASHHYPGFTESLPRIVESTDSRLFGLDDAEVQKRRRYVGHVQTEIRVGSVRLSIQLSIKQPFRLFVIRNRDIQTQSLCLSLSFISHKKFDYHNV